MKWLSKQRGTSFTGTGGEYTVDRFQQQTGSSFNGDTIKTQTDDHPPGFKNSLKITPDSTQTPSGSENLALRSQLEGFMFKLLHMDLQMQSQ